MSRVRAARAFMAKVCRGEAAVTRRPGMIEHAASSRIVLPGDVDACLLIKPPVGQSQVIGNALASSRTIPCGTNKESTSRVTRSAS